jgi:hypothetical protein
MNGIFIHYKSLSVRSACYASTMSALVLSTKANFAALPLRDPECIERSVQVAGEGCPIAFADSHPL